MLISSSVKADSKHCSIIYFSDDKKPHGTISLRAQQVAGGKDAFPCPPVPTLFHLPIPPPICNIQKGPLPHCSKVGSGKRFLIPTSNSSSRHGDFSPPLLIQSLKLTATLCTRAGLHDCCAIFSL